MNTSLTPEATQATLARLKSANDLAAKLFPGESGERQPVHTVYGGAHLFKSDSASKIGALALRSMQEYGENFAVFAKAIGLRGSETLPASVHEVRVLEHELIHDAAAVRRTNEPAWLAYAIHTRVREKLLREAVEDFRIDFEDGYGNRPDAEEDQQAVLAAQEVVRGMDAGTLPPYIGIRIKPFSEELYRRSIRTLDLFITTLVQQSGGRLPKNFVVTLPKLTSAEQVSTLADLFDLMEPKLGLAPGSLRLELMIETPQSIFSSKGEVAPHLLVSAARGRCVAAHFGTYDYTAGCSITAAHQHMTHPACDFARHVLQVALAGTGVWLSDGATNVMPIGPHRAAKGESLSLEQMVENRAVVHRAWRLHVEHVQHSLVHAYYQGWDLHPAQLPTRYAALYAFFLEGLAPASNRLRNFIEKAAQATLVGDVFDDAATGQGLLNFFIRGINCGAIHENEALGTGLTLEELHAKSFVKILNNRKKLG